MTAGQRSTFDDLIDLTTTYPVEITNKTAGSGMESSKSRGFKSAVVVIGFVGTALNGLILYALVATKQHKKQVLIFNQNLLDFVSCFFLVASYVAKLCDIDLNGTSGYWLCLTILSDGCSWGPFMSSMINLLVITIERYLKVVYHVWVKKNLRKWMIYSTAVFAWIGGSVIAIAVTIHTTDVLDGVCYTQFFWKSQAARTTYGIWYFLSFYVIIILVFTFCYGRIFVAVHRQARVMAAHSGGPGSSTAQTQSKKIKTNVIKTMLLVSVLFAITLAPASVYVLLLNIHTQLTFRETGFFGVVLVGYLYICVNPFIYATNFDPVKRVLLNLIPCMKTTQPLESIDMT